MSDFELALIVGVISFTISFTIGLWLGRRRKARRGRPDLKSKTKYIDDWVGGAPEKPFEVCGSRGQYPGTFTMVGCQRPENHDGMHRYGDWEWKR